MPAPRSQRPAEARYRLISRDSAYARRNPDDNGTRGWGASQSKPDGYSSYGSAGRHVAAGRVAVIARSSPHGRPSGAASSGTASSGTGNSRPFSGIYRDGGSPAANAGGEPSPAIATV